MSWLVKGGKINIFSNKPLKASANSASVFITALILQTQKSQLNLSLRKESVEKGVGGAGREMTGQFNF